MEYLKTFEWFRFSLKYKSFVKFSKQKIVLSQIFLNFLRIFASLRGSFFEYEKNFAPPPGIRPSFLPRGRKLDKKICPGGRDSLVQKNFPRGCPGDVPSWNWLRHNSCLVLSWLGKSIDCARSPWRISQMWITGPMMCWSTLPPQLQAAIYRPDSFVLMLRYCANLKVMRYESTSLNSIVADKSHRVIVAYLFLHPV